ncbi:ATP-dependent acyl-CoA ligase [Nocardioides sp. AN3]
MPTPTPRSFAEAVEQRSGTEPDGELVRLAGGAAWSAGALWDRSVELARGLAALVGSRDSVATATTRGPEAIALTTALSWLGAVELALPDGIDEATARRLATASRCRVTVASPTRAAGEPFLTVLGDHAVTPLVLTDSGTAETPSLDDLRAHPHPLPHHVPDLLSPAAVMVTSGTTGRAKGALLPNGAGIAQAQRVRAAMGYDAADALLSVFSWQHINARHASFLPAVLAGARQVIAPRFSASTFWETTRGEGVTAFNFMGALCAILLRRPSDAADRDHAVTRAYGGPAPAWMVEAMAERFGVELRQAYACTELADVSLTGDEVRAGAAGRPTADYDIRLVSADGSDASDGEEGALLVRPRRSGITFSEYVGDPQATEAAWDDGWFRTGDRVRLDDGWLTFVGRSADVIRRRGLNIAPDRIEEAALSLPAVAAAAAVGVPSELTEDDILLVVVPTPGVVLTPEAVRRHCTARLPRHAVPRFISIEQAIPRNASLKVLRSSLRDRGVPETAWDGEQSLSNVEHM